MYIWGQIIIMAIDKMKKPDPEKKNTLPDVTVVGVRKKPVDLPEVTVTGVRKKPVEEKVPTHIYSDEFKSKYWERQRERGFKNNADDMSVAFGPIDVNSNENKYKRKKELIGKLDVHYSDGAIKKLGEDYSPDPYRKSPDLHGVKSKPDNVSGGWREWHKKTKKEQYDN